MFFILSKVLAFLFKPITWLFGLLLYALLGRRPRRAVQLAVALAFLFSNQLLFNLVIRAWEPNTLTADAIVEPYDIGILLGGFSNPRIQPGRDRHNLNDRANRFVNALELYRRGKIRKVLISGGNGQLTGKGPLEAEQARDFLLALGLPPEDILIENQSRNTYENARYTYQLLQDTLPGASCLLLTSAWHMRRAEGAFTRAGLSVTPFPVDYLSEEWHFSFDQLLLPNARTFALWELLLKEWVGYFAYWLRGYL